LVMKRTFGFLALATITAAAMALAGSVAPAAAKADTILKGDVFGSFFFHPCPPDHRQGPPSSNCRAPVMGP
jgi:hypothetical protein